MDIAFWKIIAMLLLGFGSFLVAMIPGCFLLGRHNFIFVKSILLSFVGGVLISTAMLCILPSAREDLPKTAEFWFLGGFFIVYLVGELVHWFRQRPNSVIGIPIREVRTAYLEVGREGEQPIVLHEEGHDSSAVGTIGMLVALLFHSCLEGFVIGVQSTREQIIVLLIAVSSHKCVVGLCLGVELTQAPGGPGGKVHVVSALLYSLVSIFGVGFGAKVPVHSQGVFGSILVLQAMAGGISLYVALSEVIPRERFKRRSIRPSAGVCQCIAVVAGVILMAIINTYVHEPHRKNPTAGG